MDTIVASATPLTAAGAIGIVRVSGDDALKFASEIFSAKNLDFSEIEPRKMYLGTIKTKNFADRAFCVYYKTPLTYTGEDVIEFQTHGGKTVQEGVIRALVSLGARPALPGEFTKRAFLNGKLSLMEAEGVADIINADSEAEAMQAYRMMSGEMSKGIYDCEASLLEAEANLEAVLDYPEELDEDTVNPTFEILKFVLSKITELLKNSEISRVIKNGATVTLAGLTNVGKSSLMNALLRDDRAIVTEISGTTRDTLRERLEIDGIKVNLVDTAGIRESDDRVERIGIERAREAIKGADLVLFLRDLSEPESEEEKMLLAETADKKRIIVGNKGDRILYPRDCDLIIEAKNGTNIDKLVELMVEKLGIRKANVTAGFTGERHVFALKKAAEALASAIGSFGRVTLDCTIVDVREAYKALAEMTGADADEDVVNRIFSKFCVGK